MTFKNSYRHPSNRNLTISTDNRFRGHRVQGAIDKPLVVNYLETTYHTMNKAIERHRRTFAVRFDLHFPAAWNEDQLHDKSYISPFIASLKSKIRNDRDQAMKRGALHDTELFYVWGREVGDQNERPHYHVLILLNRDAYHTLGHFNPDHKNTHTRLLEAWSSALSIPLEQCIGLVQIIKAHHLTPKDGYNSFNDLFYHASYLCKDHSKQYGNHRHSFGSSRLS